MYITAEIPKVKRLLRTVDSLDEEPASTSDYRAMNSRVDIDYESEDGKHHLNASL